MECPDYIEGLTRLGNALPNFSRGFESRSDNLPVNLKKILAQSQRFPQNRNQSTTLLSHLKTLPEKLSSEQQIY